MLYVILFKVLQLKNLRDLFGPSPGTLGLSLLSTEGLELSQGLIAKFK
jgi:hypothetical protein